MLAWKWYDPYRLVDGVRTSAAGRVHIDVKVSACQENCMAQLSFNVPNFPRQQHVHSKTEKSELTDVYWWYTALNGDMK